MSATASSDAAATRAETGTATPTATGMGTQTPTATVPLTSTAPIFPGSSPTPAGPIGAGLLLAALAVAALFLARRRRAAPRLVQVVESASLGPKRALVVARFGDELLVLGSSEGGISLLATRPAPPAAAADPAPARLPVVTSAAAAPLAAAFGRLAALLRPRAAPPAAHAAPHAFAHALGESLEDVELRRKLAAGRAGSVR
jgi:flagellar biogenesis protein FliO